MDNVQKFIDIAKQSHFYHNFYTVDIDTEEFIVALMFFINRPLGKEYDSGNATLQNLIEQIYSSVPAFQRNNDKWTDEMQSGYVSNILQGCKAPPLMLYTVGNRNRGKTHCKILDGLQRITAMIKLFTDESMLLNVNNGEMKLTAGELMKNKQFIIHMRGITQGIRIYEFDTEIEVVKHYIAINENITHSSEDIERAKLYLAKLESEL